MDDIFKGKWNQFKGKVKEKWGKLSDNDITEINGRREQLLGKLQSRYGWQQKQAEEELKRFERSLEGERGQRVEAEYDRDESRNPRTQGVDKDYFEREKEIDEERNHSDREDKDFPKRKVR